MALFADPFQWPRLAAIALVFLASDFVTADEPASQGSSSHELKCVQTDAHLIIFRGDAEVLRYNIVAPNAPDEARAAYERSGYIHPIYTPGGRIVTGDFAADHPHQHGLFVAWTNASFRGKPVDFWNQQKGRGVVLHDRVISIDNQARSAGFSVGVKHYALDEDGVKSAILDDVWTVRVRIVHQKDQESRYAIEFSIAQTNVTDHPLTINEYHYGGIGFRGNNAWYTEESAKALSVFVKRPKADAPPLEITKHRFLTSEGNDRRLGNHSRPQWTSLYGIVQQDKVAGVKVSGSQANLGHPHPVRLHPNKPYFSISACVLGAFDINPGQTYRASYRIEVFDGTPSLTDHANADHANAD